MSLISIPVEVEEILSSLSPYDSEKIRKEIAEWIDPSNWRGQERCWIELGDHPSYDGEGAVLYYSSGEEGDCSIMMGPSMPLVCLDEY